MSRDLCIMACTFCRDPLFWRYLETLADKGGVSTEFNENAAKEFILLACQVESRSELDTKPGAAALFHKLVREPFLAWKEAQS